MKNIANSLILALGIAVVTPGGAATVDLATAPLMTATTSTVQPNIMFVLDNSGSMNWNCLPDVVCYYSPTMGKYDPTLYRNAKFNGVAYDPGVSYEPPAYFNADGTPNVSLYPSQTGVDTSRGADTSAKPNWKNVHQDGYGVQNTISSNTYDYTDASNIQGTAASGAIFGFVPGEICTAIDLKTCITGTAPTATYPYAASLRWCNSTSAATAATVTNSSGSNSCRATYTSSYKYPRYPTVRTATIAISGSSSTSVSSIQVNGVEILSAAVPAQTSATTMASNIVNAINACNGTIQGQCTGAGYGATLSGSTITIYANQQATLAAPVVTMSGGMTFTASAFTSKKNISTGTASSVPGYNLIRIIPATGTTPLYPAIGAASKASTRTDCAGTLCTANEELTNYANWWAYYHTRMQMMKTAASNAFKGMGSTYRIGFNTINNNSGVANTSILLPVGTFDASQKKNWYDKFFSINPTGSTPLRQALSTTGRYFAHKLSATDPMQYSCQQNFTILSTDGFWNENDIYVVKVDGSAMTDQDADPLTRPKYEGPTASSKSLADAAKYYADTDLRNSSLGNCTGALGEDVCTDNVFTSSTDSNTKQHMATFTLGLGADGQLIYQSDYLTAASGDYANIKNGSLNWPVPVSNAETTIDDLWHAAVNANGQYFSAKNPAQLSDGLKTALAAIQAKVGAGAAAATSALNPVSGDNYAYVASYTTADWWGNLEQRSVNTTTGVVSKKANWCVENITADSCNSPSTTITTTDGFSTQISCVTPGATADSCVSPGVFDASANTCTVPMATNCIGTLPPMVGATSDTRTIKMASGSALVDFTPANADLALFNPALLSQYSTLSTAQQANATAANLVNYLRGQKAYEMTGPNPDTQVFRYRKAVMGDAVESTPAYIKKPVYNYADPGYSSFVTSQSSRAGAVYLGTNDGMLHAFDAATGKENWAFIPTPVLPNMYKLADKNYATSHAYYVNGDITIDDVCTASCASASATWKTILVGGLHGGGKGYYALDITDPASPALLWEFTSSNYANLGYSFGRPIVTKKADGTWVVLLTTGYNNADGVGRLLVLNPVTGALIDTISTATGSSTTPSGLAQINDYVDNLSTNNTAAYVYGGDLLGNLWRFDINAGSVMKFAQLLDASSNPQPITVRPELGNVNGKRMVFVGTGKYLEASDLTNTQGQTLYGISDPDATTTLVNPRGSPLMVQQTLTAVSGISKRKVTNNSLSASSRGWFIDLPDSGERQNVPSILASGTLIAPSNVPTNTVCSPGGYGWINYVNYETGGAVLYDNPDLYASSKTNSMVVGLNVLYIGPSYTPVLNVVTADNPTPEKNEDVKFGNTNNGFQGRRVIWRELIR